MNEEIKRLIEGIEIKDTSQKFIDWYFADEKARQIINLYKEQATLQEQNRIIEIIKNWWDKTMRISSTSTRLEKLIQEITSPVNIPELTCELCGNKMKWNKAHICKYRNNKIKEILKRLKCDKCDEVVFSYNKYNDERFYCVNCGGNLGIHNIQNKKEVEE